jgi:hypothetical protein
MIDNNIDIDYNIIRVSILYKQSNFICYVILYNNIKIKNILYIYIVL